MAGETQNLRANRIDKYDPLYARYSRYIKTTDIPDIGHKAVPTATSTDWDIETYTTDANHALFPYLITVHSTNTAAQFIFYKDGTTTAMSIQVNDTENTTIVAPDCECPLMRIAPSSTLTITIPGEFINNLTDTYAAFVVAKREPIPSVVEN